MLFSFNFLFFFMFFSGLFVFCSLYNHLFLVLLSLEFLVIVLYFVLFNYLIFFDGDLFFMFFFLIFSVCEGVLGLSILVSLIRCHGNDLIMSISCLW